MRSTNSMTSFQVLEKHPDWSKGNYKQTARLALDYSNPKEWNTERLITAGLSLHECFLNGKITAQSTLLSISVIDAASKDYSALAKNGITFQKPKGVMIGLDHTYRLPESATSASQEPDGDMIATTATDGHGHQDSQAAVHSDRSQEVRPILLSLHLVMFSPFFSSITCFEATVHV